MAHVQKNNRVATGHLFDHYDRNAEDEKYKYLFRSNDCIDPERTCLNYNLAPNEKSQEERLSQRLSEVKVLKRKDVNVMCSWVVTAPKDLSLEQEEEFFKETYKFLKDRYGGEKNVISAFVHKDETSPHLHFAFVPVTKDKKKNIEKVSAKEVVTKLDLQSFHDDLQAHLDKANIRCSILNEATKEGNKSIKELKRGTAIDTLNDIKDNIENLETKLNTLESDLKALEGIESSFATVTNIKHSKIPLTSSVSIKKEDYELLLGLSKKSLMLAPRVKNLENEVEYLKDYKKDNFKMNNDVHKLKYENNELKLTLKSKNEYIDKLEDTLKYNGLEKPQQKVNAPSPKRSNNFEIGD